MKPKLPLYLFTALFPVCLSSISSGAEAINLQDQTASYETIEDSSDSSGIPFLINHSTVDVTEAVTLVIRNGSISNGSKITTGKDVQISSGSFTFTDSEWKIGTHFTLTDFSGAPSGKMTINNGTLNVANTFSINSGSSMKVEGNSSVTAGSQFSLASTADQAAVLDLNGKDVTFSVGSVNINDYGAKAKNSQLNITGASFVSKGNASFDGGDINLLDEGKITAGKFFTNNSTKVTMTNKTSITTKEGLQINTKTADSSFTADGATLKSENGEVSLINIRKDRYSLTNTNIIGKSILLSEEVRNGGESADFSSVYMKADSFKVIGSGAGQIIISGTSTADFNSSDINGRGKLLISQGAQVKLGNLTLGGLEYYAYPGMENLDAGHLTIDGNKNVQAGVTNLIRNKSSLNIQNGGKILMGTDTDTSGVGDCSIFVAQGAKLTAEKGAQVTIAGSLVVASGGTLWSGETTGTALSTTTGVNGNVVLQDGATVGSFVHDTGEGLITKSQIVDSIKAGFASGDNVKYLYQIGSNVNLGTVSVDANEIIETGAGSNVSIGTIDESAHVKVAGGTVDITSAKAGADTPVTIGSYNDKTETNTTDATVRLDASTIANITVKADSGKGDLTLATGETTVISSKVTIEANSVSVKGNDTLTTTMVNNGQISANVVAENGAIVKGSGTFNNGMTLNTGSTLIVGNSPGLMTLNGITSINADQAVFSIAGATAAKKNTNGWGSSTYSNILVQNGQFSWLGATELTLEMSSSYKPEKGTELSFNLMKFIVTDQSGNSGVTSIRIGDTDLLANESGTISGITINFSDKSEVDGVTLHPWMEGMELNYTTTTDATGKYITVTLNGTAGIPEPSSTALGIVALAGMALRRKRRQ